MKDLMLYYHIPFCVSKCAYCAFYSIPNANDELKDSYTEALICQTEGIHDSQSYSVGSVYFGGGTPSVLGAERIIKVLDAARKAFNILPDAEITVEVNPCTIDVQGLSLLKSGGVNRLSIGAQSFNNDTLKLLNRAHSAEDFVNCYTNARSVGFKNISADLIFALPNETCDDFSYSLKKLIDLEPEHISVYSLGFEEGTPLFERQSLYTFPDEDEEDIQYQTLCSLLPEAGYKHYEISNFAKEGFESRHNSGYWKRIPYLGFGAGAHSFFEGKRFEAKKDLYHYIENAHKGLNYENATTLTSEDAEEEHIMLGLRLSEGVVIKKPVPKYLIDTGLVYTDGDRVCLTEKGFRLSNYIISLLI